MGAYEALVGWRYLLRRDPNPRVLLTGALLVAFGGAALGAGWYLETRSGGQLSVFGTRAGLPRTLLGAGGAITTLGGCLGLFGLLNTWLTVFGAFSSFMVTIGVAEVILVLAVMNGFQGDLRAKIIDTQAHVVIEPAKTGGYLEAYREISAKARAVEGVVGATPVLRAEVMLKAPTNLAAVVLEGIDIDSVGQANKLPERVEHGELRFLTDPKALDADLATRRLRPRRTPGERAIEVPDPEDVPPAAGGFMDFPSPTKRTAGPPPALLVGIELRRNLALWPGEVVDVISPLGELGPEGPIPKSRAFRVGGWFKTDMLEYDSKLAYASIASVQRYLGAGDVAGAVRIRVADLEQSGAVRDRLRAALGSTVRVTDWRERNRNLFSALKLEKVAMFLVLTINILLAAFSITSTLVMTVIERKREVAILSAMGSSRAGVVRIFTSQGAFTGLVGALLGTVIGLTGGYVLSVVPLPLDPNVYYISAIPVDVRWVDVAAINVVALLVSLASTLYPAWYAASLRPVEGLTG